MKTKKVLFTALILLIIAGVQGYGQAVIDEIVTIGNFRIVYGGVGGNAVLDFVDKEQFSEKIQGDWEDRKRFFEDWLNITRVFTKEEKEAIELGVRYWAERMGAMMPAEEIIIYVGFVDDPTGGALSYTPSFELHEDIIAGVSLNGTVFDKFVNGRTSPYPHGLADNIIIFNIPWGTSPTRQLLSNGTMATMIHELGHALGIMGRHKLVDPEDGLSTRAIFNEERFTAWNSHLRDVFGKAATPGMAIEMNVITGAESENDPNIFQIFSDDSDAADFRYPTFHGENVDALTGGRGMPVSTLSGAFHSLDGVNSLGHPGIMQSAMSYGIIQNIGFTEMEFAAFQDMGYDIDRSLFFGRSYYYDVGGNEQINTLGFGTAAKPNTSILGLGTHIMRNDLNLTQAADIYAHGYGGGGVRIDGVGNSLFIPQGVTVAANGGMGTGLLVSYGSGNTINLGGRVEALGPGGIGAHFGIGAAMQFITSHFPDLAEFAPDSYASLSVQQKYEFQRAFRDFQGPLVQDFTITGRLAGSLAAIGIEDDAHVANIAVCDGAVIFGNMYSAWARDAWFRDIEYATTVTFGQAGKNGIMRMDGDIIWHAFRDNAVNSLDIVQAGGRFDFNGDANVYSWQINPGAVLSGNSAISIEGPGPFVNNGLISPGNSIGTITVDGDYTQGATGGLLMKFTSSEADQFIVTGGVDIHESATLTLQALPVFYTTGWQREFTNQDLFGNSTALRIISFNDEGLLVTSIPSPTLSTMLDRAGETLFFNITRAVNAYSQYAFGATGRSLGNALLNLSENELSGDMLNLFIALDYSALDGSTVSSALRQLAPSAYDNTARASLFMSQQLSSQLLDQLTADGISVSETREIFILPMAGFFRQDSWGDNQGFTSSFGGFMGGVNSHFDKGLAGIHAAYIQLRAYSRPDEAPTYSEVSGLRLGVHGSLFPYQGFFFNSFLNAGFENTTMTRHIEIDNYKRTNNALYTSFTAAGNLSGGYEWQSGILRFGPLAGLDYGLYRLPSLIETDGEASRLKLESTNFHSLRSLFGGQLGVQAQVAEKTVFHAVLRAQWAFEMLNNTGSTASFVDYSGNTFSVENRNDDRNALALNVSLKLVNDNTLSISVFANTELFRTDSSMVQGGLSVAKRF
jgi:uncharacterized protein YhjY with autotransporter beta-barrel domain